MTGSSRQQGFTLIEIMVVIVILGLMATVAVFSLGGSSERRELEQLSRELLLVLQVAGERAILDNAEIGVQVVDNEVNFLQYLPAEQSWEPFNDRPFQSHTWASAFEVELETASEPPKMPTNEENSDIPDLVFFSSGETTPFRLAMSLIEDPDLVYRIETDGLNEMRFLQPDEQTEVRLE